jgi:hypothetical protein
MNCTNPIYQTENRSAVQRFLFDPQGYIYGFVLTDGMEVYLPSKLLKDFYDAVDSCAAANSGAIRTTCDWCGLH